MRLNGKVAIVTGGAGELGKAIAQRFKAEGAHVVITDLQGDVGRATAHKLGCTFVQQDVVNEARWTEVIDEVEKRLGSVHILVNNAGIVGSTSAVSPEDTSLEGWKQVFSVNADSVFLGCRAAIAAMRHTGSGSIINMSSVAGLLATPYATAYGASKATVWQLTKTVAQHCAQQKLKIRCNSLHPGIVRTPLWERLVEEEARKRGMTVTACIEEACAGVPLGGFTLPEDVAAAAAYLASEDSRHVTGAQLIVDGGVFGCDTFDLQHSQPSLKCDAR